MLAEQNRAWGCSPATLHNIRRLREGAFAVVTGQQVGLFGGPLLALLKVASVLALARQVESSGVECVPVFWMASEDHDLDEVNQALLLTHDYALASFNVPASGIPDSPVANVRSARGQTPLRRKLRNCWATRLRQIISGRAIAKARLSPTLSPVCTRIFAEQGLILLDPSDPKLHRIAAPLFGKRLVAVRSWTKRCLTNRELGSANYHEQVKVTATSTPLFALVNGARVPVHLSNGGRHRARTALAGRVQNDIRSIPRTSMPMFSSAGDPGLLVTDARLHRRPG